MGVSHDGRAGVRVLLVDSRNVCGLIEEFFVEDHFSIGDAIAC
jgi:hypothetical protein